ncbi:MAG: hypothetical protein DYG90_09800, partial [Chloroflexi bacterium CFX6]|nr:hypothetical protein [Chloroflexi bacterium CFX6]
ERVDADAARRVPLLRHRAMAGGRATAYVCRQGACQLPVTDASALSAQLGAPWTAAASARLWPDDTATG